MISSAAFTWSAQAGPQASREPAVSDQRRLLSAAEWLRLANLPKDFPAKSTVYGYFQRFCADGTWARLHGVLFANCRDLEGREPMHCGYHRQSVGEKRAECMRRDRIRCGQESEGLQASHSHRYAGAAARLRCAFGGHSGPRRHKATV